ncbi:hypothetical protein BH23CHL2_BH23CHL2_22440 [soil metagenome]
MSAEDLGREKSLEAIDQDFQEFLDLVRSVPEADMLEPDTVGRWSGKDVIADIAGWERVVMKYLEAKDRGWAGYLPPAEPDGTWDQFNQSNVDPTRDWSLAEVIADFEQTHHAFMRVAAASEHTNWPPIVRITKTHYEEHHDDLRGISDVVRRRTTA